MVLHKSVCNNDKEKDVHEKQKVPKKIVAKESPQNNFTQENVQIKG